MNFNDDDTCHHFIVYYFGLQEIGEGKPLLKLYNCLECKSTITIDDEDLWLYSVVEKPINEFTAGV